MLRLTLELGGFPGRIGRRHALAAIIVAMATLLATPVAGASGSKTALNAGCVAVAVTADRPTSILFVDGFETGDLSIWADRTPAFSATEILDVLLEVGLEDVDAGIHVVELRVVAPTGHLFQTLTVPVSTDPGSAGLSVQLQGFPHPVTVRLATTRAPDGSGRAQVTARLPVAGTQIVSHSIYGTWRVEAAVDGMPSTCPEPIRFVLVP